MARVTATKLRQVIVVVGGDLPDGFTPENIAFYHPDGAPFDFSSIVAAGLSWGSAWTVEGMYEPLTMVKHDNALWIAVANTLIEAGVEPGVPLPSTTDAPGGVEPAGTYTRLAG